MARAFSIWVVCLSEYQHSRCFDEVALALRDAFAALGHDAPIVNDPAKIEGTAIVLGGNLLTPDMALPPKMIIYNLEQVQKVSDWVKPQYIELLKRHPVWDYSERNIEAFKTYGVEASLCGIGYMPALTSFTPVEEDIDVVFVGTTNPRRIHVLQQLALLGKNVNVGYNLYAAQRDTLLARAKIILNLHFYDAQVFEIVRVSYLLANRKCVVSETGQDTQLEAPLKDGIAFAAYDDLVSTCLRLLDQSDERARLAKKGFECFSAQSQVPMLARALASLAIS